MWDDLSAAIAVILKTATNKAGQVVLDASSVFEYGKSKFDQYPCATITPFENANPSFADTLRNRREYIFSIKIYQERGQKGEAETERLMRQLTDSVITIFDANPYLKNVLQGQGFAMPIPSRWAYIQSEQIDVRMAEVLIQCVVIK